MGNDRDQVGRMLIVVNLGVGNKSNYFCTSFFFSNLLKWKEILPMHEGQTDKEKDWREGSKSKFQEEQPGKSRE